MYTGSSSMAMRICTNFGTAVGLLLLLTSCVNSQSAFDRCHLLFPKEACYAVFTSLKENLLNNTINIYELQRAFYPMGRFTSSVLLNILYSVNFTDTSSLSDTPVCIGVSNSSWLLENGGYQFLTGWSSSEIFNVISPLQLSQIQLQISNDIFSLFIIPGSGVAYPRRFGWADMIRDAQNSLVKLESTNLVNINITLDTISCVPDTELLHSSLQEITIMLKVWASTEGRVPEEINEDNLGFVTEPGFEMGDIDKINFRPFFAVMVTCTSCILGLFSIAALGALFPNIFYYLSEERRQFKFYFFALSVSSFLLNLVIISIDLQMIPKWCHTTHYSYLTHQEERRKCSGLVVAKICYFILAIICSFIAALVTSRNYVMIGLQNEMFKKHERILYILCCWSIVLFTSLVVWAIPPTLLMMLIYPSIIVTLTFIMIASIFWFSVVLTIPQLLISNFKKKSHCLDTLLYLTPFCGLVVIMFAIGLITVIYLNSTVFGSDIGGAIGILVATVPSIFLTLFVEFYRDWFLTRTTRETDRRSTLESESGEGMNNTKIQMNSLVISQCKENDSNRDTGIIVPTQEDFTLKYEDEISQQKPKRRAVRTTGYAIKRRKSGLTSTGEPPGFLHKRLQKLSFRSRAESLNKVHR